MTTPKPGPVVKPQLDHPDWETVNWDSNIVQHAWREYKLLGEDLTWVRPILEMFTIFASMGHSGGSAESFIPQINTLLNYENLLPLSDDPREWENRTEMSGYPLWQNRRNSKALSTDGGMSYTLTDDPQQRTNLTVRSTFVYKGKDI